MSAASTSASSVLNEGNDEVDLFDVIRACFRRWYVVFPLLILTAWLAHSKYTTVQPVYYSNAVVGIAPTNETIQYTGVGTPIPRNGLLDVGGAALITNMTVIGLEDPAIRAQVVAGGGRPNYEVRMFPTPLTGAGAGAQLPLIMIEATEPDLATATRTVELVAAQTDTVMQQLQRQAGVPDSQIVRALAVAPPSTVGGPPSRSKSVLYVGGVGLAASIFVGVMTDLLFAHISNRRRNSTHSGLAGTHSAETRNRQKTATADTATSTT